ncbi:cupin domain-containing protein [Arthrobacter sp. NyZ413]|uniref:cupin domain-containing protein n=1 Tax=Arthrobacter sp. NyZ413 TaxID=3144669 RepID=UPI003BF7877A
MTEDRVAWPELASVPVDNIIAGLPKAATVVITESPTYQLGLWKVTPGAFSSDHTGYAEFIHVIEGSGRLVSEFGTVTELRPGTTSLMPSGWRGRWEIDTPLTKVFTIIHNPY